MEPDDVCLSWRRFGILHGNVGYLPSQAVCYPVENWAKVRKNCFSNSSSSVFQPPRWQALTWSTGSVRCFTTWREIRVLWKKPALNKPTLMQCCQLSILVAACKYAADRFSRFPWQQRHQTEGPLVVWYLPASSLLSGGRFCRLPLVRNGGLSHFWMKHCDGMGS